MAARVKKHYSLLDVARIAALTFVMALGLQYLIVWAAVSWNWSIKGQYSRLFDEAAGLVTVIRSKPTVRRFLLMADGPRAQHRYQGFHELPGLHQPYVSISSSESRVVFCVEEHGWPLRSLGLHWDYERPVEVSYRAWWIGDAAARKFWRADEPEETRIAPQLHGGISLQSWSNPDWRVSWKALPLTPIWPAFIINHLFYWVILIMIVLVPRVVNVLLRWKSGKCLACGYPRVDAEVCPECGAKLRRVLAP